MSRFALLLSVLCFALPAQASVFQPEPYTLANGMEVVIVKNNLSPAVAHTVWYKVGAVDDPKGQSGVAHYLEHLMFRGTPLVPAGDFSASVMQRGGQDNAFTTHDATAYHEMVAAEHLGFVMQLEADRMRHLVIDDATALPELDVVRSERQERTDNNPAGIFSEKLFAALFPDHPYGVPVIGTADDLAAMTPAKARAQYTAHYAPNNAVLIVSGAVETQDVLRLADGTFGRIPRKTLPPRVTVSFPKRPTTLRVEQQDKRVKLPRFSLLMLAPSESVSRGGEPSLRAFDVLAELLGGGEVGLLYRDLVRDQAVAASVSASYDSMARGPAVFGFSAIPASGVSDAVLENALVRRIHHYETKGFSATDVEKAKQRLEQAALFARDSLMAPCEVFGNALTTGGSIQSVESWPEAIKRVTVADVQAALRALRRSPHSVTGWLRPVGETKE